MTSMADAINMKLQMLLSLETESRESSVNES